MEELYYRSGFDANFGNAPPEESAAGLVVAAADSIASSVVVAEHALSERG